MIDTGERKYVLLALAGGYFEPRDVQVGPPVGDLYPVVAGGDQPHGRDAGDGHVDARDGHG